jgi:polyphosphate kinase
MKEASNIHELYAKAQEDSADEVVPVAISLRQDSPPATHNIYAPSMYMNRELSWLDFNQRVLNEALDPEVPLLERLKFIVIAASNLDEFFMIRVAGLQQQLALDVPDVPPDGLTPEEALERISAIATKMIRTMSDCFLNELIPALEQHGIILHRYADLDERAQEWSRKYFFQEVFSVLTPLAIDPGHPFPHLLNRSLNLFMRVSDSVTGEQRSVVVQVPAILPRLVPVTSYKSGIHYILLSEIIAAHANALFPGLELSEWYRFRVTRNTDLEIAEDEASDLLKTIEEQVRRRRWGAVVRLEVDAAMPKKIRRRLIKAMKIGERDLYEINGPLNLADFMEWTRIDKKHLKDPQFNPRVVGPLSSDENIFEVMRRQDIFLHHPYDSFSSVVELIETAAEDPKVLAIKQTLYRTNGDSSIVKALADAAENGKQVTAFVELKARFDEENNIVWARALERAGVHVVYGILGLKTHCKLSLVVRREKKGLRTYVHTATGNYNESTARLYTDMGLLTASEEIGYEATALFNYLTGYSHQTEWNSIFVAPISLRQKLLALIQREMQSHSKKHPARIIAKMNALVDAQIIRALYRASQAGVRIDLIVRGICCLRPGVPGVSENIRVRSIVGRFLEHSRVFVFGGGDDPDVYISSADWMPRNLNRRVEMMTIIRDEHIKRVILETILPVTLADNVKAYELCPDGIYRRFEPSNGQKRLSSQEQFIKITEDTYRKRKKEAEDEEVDYE